MAVDRILSVSQSSTASYHCQQNLRFVIVNITWKNNLAFFKFCGG